MRYPEFTLIGQCVKTHGIDGEILISLESGVPEDIVDQRAFFLQMDGDMIPQLIVKRKTLGDSWLFQFKRISSKEDAQDYVGASVFVESSILPQPIRDPESLIVGWKVHDLTSGAILTILSEEEYPEQIMWRCVDPADQEYLIPVVDEWIQDIDKAEQKITLESPEGLL